MGDARLSAVDLRVLARIPEHDISAETEFRSRESGA
jgi:hypothetical protein